MKVRSRVLTAAMALALAGCAAWNAPINTVLKDGERPGELLFGGRTSRMTKFSSDWRFPVAARERLHFPTAC